MLSARILPWPAQRPGQRFLPSVSEQHPGLQQERQPLPAIIWPGAVELPPIEHDAWASHGYASARTGEAECAAGDQVSRQRVGHTLEGDTTESQAEVRKNTVTSNGRVGVFFGAQATGIIFENPAINDNGLDPGKAEFGAGVWLQGGAKGVKIEKNQVLGTRYAGIGLTSASVAIIFENSVGNTLEGLAPGEGLDFGKKFSVGDGIALLRGAAGTIDGNTGSGNFRAGILLDESMATLSPQTIDGGEFALICERKAECASLDVSGFASADLVPLGEFRYETHGTELAGAGSGGAQVPSL